MKTARLLWPGVIVALLALPITLALLQRVPDINDAEIVDEASGREPVFVALGDVAGDDGARVAGKVLWQAGPQGLLAHDEIRLLLVTYGARLTLVHGEIRLAGTGCVYQTDPGSTLRNAHYLAFRRGHPCPAAIDAGAEWSLTLTFRGDGRVGLATYFVAPEAVDPNWLALTAPGAGDRRPVAVVRGRYVDTLGAASLRRVDLLAYVWNVADSPLWIWSALALALVVMFAGTLWVAPGEATPSLLRGCAGVGSIAFALALCYVVLVPPLQAPDEPDHMLSFAEVAARPQQVDSLAALARRGHFARIHFRPAERFRPVDIGRPAALHWDPDVFAHTVAGRSLTTWAWWRLLAPAAGRFTAGETILMVRLANAVAFAVALALATAVLLWTSASRVAAPHTIGLALLLVPTLPFFATHVSEFALLTSSYVVLAAIVAALFLDGERAHWLGLPLGMATSAILLGGRSGLPFVATMATVMAGRALLGSPSQVPGDWRRIGIFWFGLGIGLMLLALLPTAEFRAGLWPADARQIPDRARWAAEFLRQHPWVVGVAIPAGLAIELVTSWLRRRLPPARPLLARLVGMSCALLATAVVASLVYSAMAPYPSLSFLESTPPASAVTYAREVLTVAATSLRVTNHDWLLSASFWGGFGWLDTLPGDGFVSLLVLLVSLAIVGLLWQLGRSGHWRRAVWLTLLGVGWSVTLGLYAVSSYVLHRNLHGRYLVGLYVCMLAVAACGLGLWPRTGQRRLSREVCLVVLACGLHAFALRFILLRYF